MIGIDPNDDCTSVSTFLTRRQMKVPHGTVLALAVVTLVWLVESGPTLGVLTYGACQTACNAAVVSCYGAAGLVFGTVTVTAAASGPVGWWAWLTGASSAGIATVAKCGAAQGVCMAACAAAAAATTVAPTP